MQHHRIYVSGADAVSYIEYTTVDGSGAAISIYDPLQTLRAGAFDPDKPSLKSGFRNATESEFAAYVEARNRQLAQDAEDRDAALAHALRQAKEDEIAARRQFILDTIASAKK
jgi:hypothetical protein